MISVEGVKISGGDVERPPMYGPSYGSSNEIGGQGQVSSKGLSTSWLKPSSSASSLPETSKNNKNPIKTSHSLVGASLYNNGAHAASSVQPTLSTLDESDHSNSDSHLSTWSSTFRISFTPYLTLTFDFLNFTKLKLCIFR